MRKPYLFRVQGLRIGPDHSLIMKSWRWRRCLQRRRLHGSILDCFALPVRRSQGRRLAASTPPREGQRRAEPAEASARRAASGRGRRAHAAAPLAVEASMLFLCQMQGWRHAVLRLLDARRRRGRAAHPEEDWRSLIPCLRRWDA